MAKKKLDLSGMYNSTSKTHDIHSISTSQAQDIIETPHGKYAAYLQAEKASEKPVDNHSRRTNMAFSDDLYEKIYSESERLSVGLAYYVNAIIRQADPEKVHAYYEAQPIKASKSCIPRKKGKPAKRITIKIDPDVYDILTVGAERHNQTLTQYANLVLESNI